MLSNPQHPHGRGRTGGCLWQRGSIPPPPTPTALTVIQRAHALTYSQFRTTNSPCRNECNSHDLTYTLWVSLSSAYHRTQLIFCRPRNEVRSLFDMLTYTLSYIRARPPRNAALSAVPRLFSAKWRTRLAVNSKIGIFSDLCKDARKRATTDENQSERGSRA